MYVDHCINAIYSLIHDIEVNFAATYTLTSQVKLHISDSILHCFITEALERQRQVFERQMQMLRSQMMSPSTPSMPYPPIFDPFSPKSGAVGTPSGGIMHPKYQQWAQERFVYCVM